MVDANGEVTPTRRLGKPPPARQIFSASLRLCVETGAIKTQRRKAAKAQCINPESAPCGWQRWRREPAAEDVRISLRADRQAPIRSTLGWAGSAREPHLTSSPPSEVASEPIAVRALVAAFRILQSPWLSSGRIAGTAPFASSLALARRSSVRYVTDAFAGFLRISVRDGPSIAGRWRILAKARST